MVLEIFRSGSALDNGLKLDSGLMKFPYFIPWSNYAASKHTRLYLNCNFSINIVVFFRSALLESCKLVAMVYLKREDGRFYFVGQGAPKL